MGFKYSTAVLAIFVLCFIAPAYQKIGWLDKVVAHRKKLFLEDLARTLPNVELKATIEKAPQGYEDSALWDTKSVIYLVLMIKRNGPKPLRRMINNILAPSRRMSKRLKETYIRFPSWGKDHPNEFYYNFDGSSESHEPEDYDPYDSYEIPKNGTEDDQIIVVSNPVEARLPSARISVRLLKDILTHRAEAARYMPTTLLPTIDWSKGNSTDEKTTTVATTVAATTSANSTDPITTTPANNSTGGNSTADGNSTVTNATVAPTPSPA